MTVVLDSYALIALVQGEAGAITVRDAVEQGDALVSWINLGEVYYVLARRVGNDLAHQIVLDAQEDCRVEAPDGRLVLDATRIKSGGRIAYADCFAVATARRDGLPLLTGDPEILALSKDVEVVDLRGMA
ncbi:MAG: type II toxin-antitoxin system VapC family toxin [Patulibacter sp.]